MNKLSDLELEKRIAEIEGITLGRDDVPQLEGMHNVNGSWKYYNPLTDKALLLDLIFDHNVSICRYRDCVYIDSDYTDKPPKALVSFISKEEFPRAALECIVEANNG